MKAITIGSENAGRRLDKYLSALLKYASKGLIYSSLRKKNIKLNNKKADGSTLLADGDLLELFFSDETSVPTYLDLVVFIETTSFRFSWHFNLYK